MFEFIKKLFNKTEETSKGLGLVKKSHWEVETPWQVYEDRKNLWNDYQHIDLHSALVARALDVIAEFCTTFPEPTATGIYAEADSDEISTVLNQMINRLSFNHSAFEYVRYMVKFGEMFHEIVLNSDEKGINRSKFFPYSYQILINWDEFGRLKQGDPTIGKTQPEFSAYEQCDEANEIIAAFWPSQIVQFKGGVAQGERYPTALLYPARNLYRNLEIKQNCLVLNQMARLQHKLIARVPILAGSPTAVQDEIMKNFADSFSEKKTIYSDTGGTVLTTTVGQAEKTSIDTIFTPRIYTEDGKIIDYGFEALKIIDDLEADLEDLKLDMALLLARLGVPAKYLNLNLSRSFITKEEEPNEAFLRFIRRIQSNYMQGVATVCQYELVLKGIDPTKNIFDLIMPKMSWLSTQSVAKTELLRANTAAIWSKLGLPPEIIAKNFINLSAEDIKKWQDFIKTQVKTDGKDLKKKEGIFDEKH